MRLFREFRKDGAYLTNKVACLGWRSSYAAEKSVPKIGPSLNAIVIGDQHHATTASFRPTLVYLLEMKVKGGGSQDLYKDIFDSFDVDKNGYLSVRELVPDMVECCNFAGLLYYIYLDPDRNFRALAQNSRKNDFSVQNSSNYLWQLISFTMLFREFRKDGAYLTNKVACLGWRSSYAAEKSVPKIGPSLNAIVIGDQHHATTASFRPTLVYLLEMKVKGGGSQDLYKDIFDSFDVDKNGYLSVRELGKCMSALNKKISKTELKFLITCADKDENGKMDCYEFSLMASVLHMLSIDDLKELRESDPDLGTPDLRTPRFRDRISFPRYRKLTLFDPDLVDTPDLVDKSLSPEGVPKSGSDCITLKYSRLPKPYILVEVAECQQLIDGADKDSDGEMSFFEFVVMVKQDEGFDEEKDLYEAFNMFDLNGNGTIDRSELTNVFKQMGKEPTSEELEGMFQQADGDGDGNISFEEFKAIMM
eukprot:sb/3464306/